VPYYLTGRTIRITPVKKERLEKAISLYADHILFVLSATILRDGKWKELMCKKPRYFKYRQFIIRYRRPTMAELMKHVEELAEDRQTSESQVIEGAIEYGVQKLWEKDVLAKYIRGDIAREKAVELVGIELVKRAEKEKELVEDDVAWAAA
jgi:hypothetical protein